MVFQLNHVAWLHLGQWCSKMFIKMSNIIQLDYKIERLFSNKAHNIFSEIWSQRNSLSSGSLYFKRNNSTFFSWQPPEHFGLKSDPDHWLKLRCLTTAGALPFSCNLYRIPRNANYSIYPSLWKNNFHQPACKLLMHRKRQVIFIKEC